MKKFSAILALAALLLFCGGCDWNSIDSKVAAVRAAEPFVHSGEVMAYQFFSALHSVGKLPDSIWNIVQVANQKYTALHNRFPAACDEWDKVKGKPAGQVILQLVTDMNKIIQEINDLLNEWKAPMSKIRDYQRELDAIPADVRRYLLTA